MIRAILIACAMLLAAAAAALSQNRPAFDADARPTAPDCRDRFAWAALPDRPNPAAQAPPNADRPAIDPSLARADVFYVHPTTELSKAHWNQDLADAVTNDWTDSSVVARQASVFSACCRIYAPRYRQAAPGSVTSTDGSGQKAFDLAYWDVRNAFLFYLAHYNHGRPFILAGHSQGSLHIYRLLKEMVDGKPLQRRLVAAYTPGIPIALGEFGSATRRSSHAPSRPTPVASQAGTASRSRVIPLPTGAMPKRNTGRDTRPGMRPRYASIH